MMRGKRHRQPMKWPNFAPQQVLRHLMNIMDRRGTRIRKNSMDSQATPGRVSRTFVLFYTSFFIRITFII